MEPKYLTKTHIHPISDILGTKNNKDSDILCLQQISKEKIEFITDFWIFPLLYEV